MNPDELLTELRGAIWEEVENEDPMDRIDRIRKAFNALNHHLVEGGELPDDWNYERVDFFIMKRMSHKDMF